MSYYCIPASIHLYPYTTVSKSYFIPISINYCINILLYPCIHTQLYLSPIVSLYPYNTVYTSFPFIHTPLYLFAIVSLYVSIHHFSYMLLYSCIYTPLYLCPIVSLYPYTPVYIPYLIPVSIQHCI